ncbi:MAG TPA: type II secretion system protein [Candidatus Saccharimonadales bacterium]|nr:type II secretion system protein [Candidatus Saccharimonadales bacterium]
MQIPKLQNITESDKGFTLIELLVVIGVLGILLAITLIAINPNKHFQDARNTQRSSNVGEFLNAIYEYESANTGNVPPSLTNMGTTALPLGKAPTFSSTNTTFASPPALVYTGLTSNTITTGTVLVNSCSNSADNGEYPVTAGNGTTLTVTNAGGAAGATGCVISTKIDMCSDLTTIYIADLPKDPSTGSVTGGSTPCAGGVTAYDTGYTLTKTASGSRFTIAAPAAEDSATISVTR